MNDWVYLHRQLMSWEWYTDSQTVHLFLHLLMKANWKPGRFRGVDIGVGELATGRKLLSAETGISEQSVRTILTRLEKTGEIRTKSTKQFSIITICNYCVYQAKESDPNQQTNQQLTNDQPTTNQQLTTSNKGIREEGKKGIKDTAPPAQGTLLEEEQPKRMAKTPPKEYTPEFAEFWKAFPSRKGRKNGKKEAFKLWWSILYSQKKTASELLEHAKSYASHCGDLPIDAERWLRNDRWEDEYESLPFDAINDAYNKNLGDVFIKSGGMNETRMGYIRDVVKRDPRYRELSKWVAYFTWIHDNFISGIGYDFAGQQTLDFVLKNQLQITEGQYQK